MEVNEMVEVALVKVTVEIDSYEPKGLLENCEATVPNIGIVASSP
jgi:hypothetical protein